MQNLKLLIILLLIFYMLIQIRHWSSWWILNNSLLWLWCWCRWLGILRDGCWRSRLLSLCQQRSLCQMQRMSMFLLSHLSLSNWISLKDKWLMRNRLIFWIWHGLLYWHRLLGCGGLTPSRSTRLDSWPSHLCQKLICAHNRWQAWARETLHDNGLPSVEALHHRVKHL